MPTLILSPRYTPDSITLWKAAISQGSTVTRAQGWRVAANAPIEDIAIYGEPLFVATIAQELDVAILEPPFNWLPSLPFSYLGRKVVATTVNELQILSFPAFVKPADAKSFPAKVYQHASDIPLPDTLPDNTPLLWSEPVTWQKEFRAFIKERQLQTLSLYARFGEYTEDLHSETELTEAATFIQRFLDDPTIQLPPAVVVDFGVTAESGWAIVEANPCFSSGIYACDPDGVLTTLARAFVPQVQLTAEDNTWIINRTV